MTCLRRKLTKDPEELSSERRRSISNGTKLHITTIKVRKMLKWRESRNRAKRRRKPRLGLLLRTTSRLVCATNSGLLLSGDPLCLLTAGLFLLRLFATDKWVNDFRNNSAPIDSNYKKYISGM